MHLMVSIKITYIQILCSWAWQIYNLYISYKGIKNNCIFYVISKPIWFTDKYQKIINLLKYDIIFDETYVIFGILKSNKILSKESLPWLPNVLWKQLSKICMSHYESIRKSKTTQDTSQLLKFYSNAFFKFLLLSGLLPKSNRKREELVYYHFWFVPEKILSI